MYPRSTLCISVFMMFGGSARAEFVTNGGFETGDFTGWTQWGDSTNAQIYGHHHTGTCGALFAPPTDGGILQTLAIGAGQSVNVRFWLGAVDRTPNSFSVTLDGQTLVSMIDYTGLPGSAFEEFSFDVVVNHPDPELRFTFQEGRFAGSFFVDDISVSAVPLPAGAVLGATGLAGVCVRAWRRRRRATQR